MIMHPAHKNPKYDAVYRFLCGLAERDLPCPQMRDVAAMVGLTQFSVGNAFYALRKAGLIRTASKHTAFGRRYVVVEIVSSGRKTAAPDKDSSAASCRDPVHEPSNGVVQGVSHHPSFAPPPHDGTIVRRDNSDLPPPLSPQMRGSLGSVVGRKLAPQSTSGRYQNYNVSPNANIPDIDRIRQINAALPKAVAIPASWNCQWIESADGEWPPAYCGAQRCHEDSPYCGSHHGRAFTGKLKHHAALTPEERAKRIERGRKIKAAIARKRDIAARREQHQQGA